MADRPIAFIYDRRLTPTLAILQLRLETCREYAADLRWPIAGEWVDVDDDALSDTQRPRFDDMIVAMRAVSAAGQAVVCLINEWERLSRDPLKQAVFRRKVALAGGYTATQLGEDDRPQGGGQLREVRPA